jgi:hypothetical protein
MCDCSSDSICKQEGLFLSHIRRIKNAYPANRRKQMVKSGHVSIMVKNKTHHYSYTLYRKQVLGCYMCHGCEIPFKYIFV